VRAEDALSGSEIAKQESKHLRVHRLHQVMVEFRFTHALPIRFLTVARHGDQQRGRGRVALVRGARETCRGSRSPQIRKNENTAAT
jgi:hypothetical protein